MRIDTRTYLLCRKQSGGYVELPLLILRMGSKSNSCIKEKSRHVEGVCCGYKTTPSEALRGREVKEAEIHNLVEYANKDFCTPSPMTKNISWGV
jgi:hypothetical protein